MTRSTHIVFAGGGSTGYLHPGLAVATCLQQRLPHVRITFAGTGKAFERHSVRANGFNYVAMPSQPMPRNPFRAMRFVTDNVAGYWASRWYLKEHHVSLGGRPRRLCQRTDGPRSHLTRHPDRAAGTKRRPEPRHALAIALGRHGLRRLRRCPSPSARQHAAGRHWQSGPTSLRAALSRGQGQPRKIPAASRQNAVRSGGWSSSAALAAHVRSMSRCRSR